VIRNEWIDYSSYLIRNSFHTPVLFFILIAVCLYVQGDDTSALYHLNMNKSSYVIKQL
jgi:hypothetical protein